MGVGGGGGGGGGGVVRYYTIMSVVGRCSGMTTVLKY